LAVIPTFRSLSLSGYLLDDEYLERNKEAFAKFKKNGVEISVSLFNDDIDWNGYISGL
jgi:hypothetical protein